MMFVFCCFYVLAMISMMLRTKVCEKPKSIHGKNVCVGVGRKSSESGRKRLSNRLRENSSTKTEGVGRYVCIPRWDGALSACLNFLVLSQDGIGTFETASNRSRQLTKRAIDAGSLQ